MSKFGVISKVLLGPTLALAVTVIGCNENMHHNNDYGYYNEQSRMIAVEVCAYTTYTVDVYVGNNYSMSIVPNGCYTFYKDLCDDEIMVLRLSVRGRQDEIWYFGNSQTRYYLEVYDNWTWEY